MSGPDPAVKSNDSSLNFPPFSSEIEREGEAKVDSFFSGRYYGSAEAMSNTSRPQSSSSQHSSSTVMGRNASFASSPTSFRPTTSRRGGRAATPSYYRSSNTNSNTATAHVDSTVPAKQFHIPETDTAIAMNNYTASLSDSALSNLPSDYYSMNDRCNYEVAGETDLERHDIQNRSKHLNPSGENRKRNLSGEKNLSCLLARSDPLMSSDSTENGKRAKSYKPNYRERQMFDRDYNDNLSRSAHLEEDSYSQLKILPSFSHDDFQPKNAFFGPKESVFRSKMVDFGPEEIDAHNILLSLGSSTFEDNKSPDSRESTSISQSQEVRGDLDTSRGKGSSPVKVLFTSSSLPFGNVYDSQLEYPSSPEEPPRIQSHSTHQTLFFDQQSSPISKQVGIESVSSFPLHSQSFDYLVDGRIDNVNHHASSEGLLKQGKHLNSVKGSTNVHLTYPRVDFDSQGQHVPPQQWQESFPLRSSTGFIHSRDSSVFSSAAYPLHQSNPQFIDTSQHSFNNIQQHPSYDHRSSSKSDLFIHYQMLSDFTFILPRLRKSDFTLDANKVHSPFTRVRLSQSVDERIQTPWKSDNMHVSTSDLNVARHRIKSAVCAFGGSVGSTLCYTGVYKQKLVDRFRESENRLSWECEESPPLVNDEYLLNTPKPDQSSKNSESTEKSSNTFSDEVLISDATAIFGKQIHDFFSSPSRDLLHMRYHCRLCGQLKQNHVCPMLKSVQRSIGVMVYPALNAFTASEPGRLAPSLAAMNNFVNGSDTSEKTPSRCSVTDPMIRKDGDGKNHPNYVTPDTIMRCASKSIDKLDALSPQRMARRQQPTENTIELKRSSEHDDANRIIESTHFMSQEVDLKPEQYRIARVKHKSYVYPPIPVPYAQRKQLSDYLLNVSTSCSSQLRDECALVLKEGREKGMWDLAVAELLTQVIMLVTCHASDVRLDGLSNYLRSVGISC